MHSILSEYEKISCQVVNVQKSGIFFSSNVSEDLKSNISNILGVHAPLNTGRYLGLPSLIGRNQKVIFAFLRERMLKRIQGWQSKLLSQAGKEILTKTVAQAVPNFYMSSFLLSVSLCQELERMMNSFWWGMKPNGTRRINGMK